VQDGLQNDVMMATRRRELLRRLGRAGSASSRGARHRAEPSALSARSPRRRPVAPTAGDSASPAQEGAPRVSTALQLECGRVGRDGRAKSQSPALSRAHEAAGLRAGVRVLRPAGRGGEGARPCHCSVADSRTIDCRAHSRTRQCAAARARPSAWSAPCAVPVRCNRLLAESRNHRNHKLVR
jgi:hypothetical protein